MNRKLSVFLGVLIVLLVLVFGSTQYSKLANENQLLREENELISETLDAYKQENNGMREHITTLTSDNAQMSVWIEREFEEVNSD